MQSDDFINLKRDDFINLQRNDLNLFNIHLIPVSLQFEPLSCQSHSVTCQSHSHHIPVPRTPVTRLTRMAGDWHENGMGMV